LSVYTFKADGGLFRVVKELNFGRQRRNNIHGHDGIDEAEFVATREKRDASFPLPDLMLAGLQVNIRGGRLPDTDECGTAFLKAPLNRFGPAAS